MYNSAEIEYHMEADEVWVVKRTSALSLEYIFTWRIIGEASITQVLPVDFIHLHTFHEEANTFMVVMSHWIPIPEPPGMIRESNIKAWRNPNGQSTQQTHQGTIPFQTDA